MDGLTLAFLFVAGVAVVYFFVMGRGKRIATMVCTRCEGTGEVRERWPDPSAPGGWHAVEGICPKCKGKGRY